jgi:hypothetical protein
VTDLPQQRPAHVIALTAQIHAAIRDKDVERLADTVRCTSATPTPPVRS